jgi:hypothetical protein
MGLSPIPDFGRIKTNIFSFKSPYIIACPSKFSELLTALVPTVGGGILMALMIPANVQFPE